MNNTIVSTGFKLTQAIISNGSVTGNQWGTPQNIYLSDNQFATSQPSSGLASDFIVGNFAFALPTDAVVTGFEIRILGKAGAVTIPPITLTISAMDNTSGTDVFYPYTSGFTSFTTANQEFILGGQNYLFGTTWTADQANNIKIALQANGDISLDSLAMNCYYYVPITPNPPTPTPSGCIDCNSPIQVQAMALELPFNIGDTVFYIRRGSFAYADGTPVQPGDVGGCDGEINFVFNQSLRKIQGQAFAENVTLDTSTGSWTVLPSGVIAVDIVSINNRGQQFHSPYAHDALLMATHPAGSEVIISNNGRFYSRFVRGCQSDIVFSPPISGKDEGAIVVPNIHSINVIGSNVQGEQNISNPNQYDIVVLANPTNILPSIESTTTATTGAGTATTLTWPHTITAANYLRVWVSTEDIAISTVTYNGVALTLVGAKTFVSANLKAALYELVSPTIGTANIVVTMASPAHISAGGDSFLDVDLVTPIDGVSSGASGNGTAPTDSGVTTVDNVLVQNVVATAVNATTFANAYPWTISGQVNAAARPGATSNRKVLLPATVSDTYSILPSGDWAMITAGIRGSTLPTAGASLVKATGTDTTAGYLDNKITIIPGTNTAVTKTILNPGANEEIQYQVDATTTAVSNSYVPFTMIGTTTTTDVAPALYTSMGYLGVIAVYASGSGITSAKQIGKFGIQASNIPSLSGLPGGYACQQFVYDYTAGKLFVIGPDFNLINSGNGKILIKQYDKSDLSTIEYSWECPAITGGSPVVRGYVDKAGLKVYIRPGYAGSIDGVTVVAGRTYEFTMSSATGGTINNTGVSFTGGASFPIVNSPVTVTGIGAMPSPIMINTTTKKFIMPGNTTKYSYTFVGGITGTTTISYGSYIGSNDVSDDGYLYKVSTQTTGVQPVGGGGTIYYADLAVVFPGYNSVLNT